MIAGVKAVIRRIGESVRGDVRYTRRPGVYAILRRGSEVLITHQAEPNPEFQLPGGGIDPGESPVTALHRLGAFRRFTYMPEYDLWAEKLCHVYIARPVRPHSDPLEPGHTALWTPIEVATQLVENDGDRMFLSALL